MQTFSRRRYSHYIIQVKEKKGKEKADMGDSNFCFPFFLLGAHLMVLRAHTYTDAQGYSLWYSGETMQCQELNLGLLFDMQTLNTLSPLFSPCVSVFMPVAHGFGLDFAFLKQNLMFFRGHLPRSVLTIFCGFFLEFFHR